MVMVQADIMNFKVIKLIKDNRINVRAQSTG